MPPKILEQVPTVDLSTFMEATEEDLGWCPRCVAFTTSMCEPDAQDRTCDDCSHACVVGAEMAMVSGMFTFEDE
jgi:hypothetical protein